MKYLKHAILAAAPLLVLIGLEVNQYTPTLDWFHKTLSEHFNAFEIALTSTPENIKTTRLPIYELRIKPFALRQLENGFPNRQDENFPHTFIRDIKHDYVDGVFWHEDEKRNIRIRYRGDSFFHWGKYKKSWRLKFPGDALFHGQRRSNLITPKFISQMENYLSYKYAHKLGILAPDAGYVHGRLNGAYLGLMLFVEQVDKHFLINHRLPEGKVYFGDDGQTFWFEADQWKAPAGIFRAQAESPDKEIQELVRLIRTVPIEPFLRQVGELVDIDAVAKWHAHMNLIGSTHQDATHNIKLIFDPSKGKFVPVVWDANGYWLSKTPSILFAANPLLAKLMFDPRYTLKKNRLLWRYLTDDFPTSEKLKMLDDTKKLIADDVRSDQLKEINRKGKLYRFTFEEWKQGVKDLRKHIQQTDYFLRGELTKNEISGFWERGVGNVSAAIHVRIESLSGVELSQLTLKGADLERVRLYADTNLNRKLDASDIPIEFELLHSEAGTRTLSVKQPIYAAFQTNGFREGNHQLVPRFEQKPSDYTLIIIQPNHRSKIQSVQVAFNNLVNDSYLGSYNLTLKKTTGPPVRIAKVPDMHKTSNEILWKGFVSIKKPTLISQKQTLVIAPGTTITLAPKASLLVEGRLIARGTKEQPIMFRGSGKTPWGVLAMFNSSSDSPHILSHCHIEGGSEATYKWLHFSGMLSAYHAPIELDHVTVTNSQGEDAVNVKYSNFHAKHLHVSNGYSDGMDADFSQGIIENSTFTENKNDGIDFSYSDVFIRDTKVVGSGNKGISVGERSRISVSNVYFEKNETGIAVKDESTARVISSTFRNNKESFSLYRKKNEFTLGGCLSIDKLPTTIKQGLIDEISMLLVGNQTCSKRSSFKVMDQLIKPARQYVFSQLELKIQ